MGIRSGPAEDRTSNGRAYGGPTRGSRRPLVRTKHAEVKSETTDDRGDRWTSKSYLKRVKGKKTPNSEWRKHEAPKRAIASGSRTFRRGKTDGGPETNGAGVALLPAVKPCDPGCSRMAASLSATPLECAPLPVSLHWPVLALPLAPEPLNAWDSPAETVFISEPSGTPRGPASELAADSDRPDAWKAVERLRECLQTQIQENLELQLQLNIWEQLTTSGQKRQFLASVAKMIV